MNRQQCTQSSTWTICVNFHIRLSCAIWCFTEMANALNKPSRGTQQMVWLKHSSGQGWYLCWQNWCHTRLLQASRSIHSFGDLHSSGMSYVPFMFYAIIILFPNKQYFTVSLHVKFTLPCGSKLFFFLVVWLFIFSFSVFNNFSCSFIHLELQGINHCFFTISHLAECSEL